MLVIVCVRFGFALLRDFDSACRVNFFLSGCDASCRLVELCCALSLALLALMKATASRLGFRSAARFLTVPVGTRAHNLLNNTPSSGMTT